MSERVGVKCHNCHCEFQREVDIGAYGDQRHYLDPSYRLLDTLVSVQRELPKNPHAATIKLFPSKSIAPVISGEVASWDKVITQVSDLGPDRCNRNSLEKNPPDHW